MFTGTWPRMLDATGKCRGFIALSANTPIRFQALAISCRLKPTPWWNTSQDDCGNIGYVSKCSTFELQEPNEKVALVCNK